MADEQPVLVAAHRAGDAIRPAPALLDEARDDDAVRPAKAADGHAGSGRPTGRRAPP